MSLITEGYVLQCVESGLFIKFTAIPQSGFYNAPPEYTVGTCIKPECATMDLHGSFRNKMKSLKGREVRVLHLVLKTEVLHMEQACLS